MPNHAAFLINLKNTIPESTWPWVVSALRQDDVIWQSFGDPDFSARAIQEFGQDPERWAPASLSFLALNIPIPTQETVLDPELRMQAIQALEGLVYPQSKQPVADRPSLGQAGLIALALLENRRKTNSWSHLPGDLVTDPATADDLVSTWGTALGVVYGLTEDRLALLKALIRPNASDSNYQLALHALLCNPRKPVDIEQILFPFFQDLPVADCARLARLLDHSRPQLANRLTNRLIELRQATKRKAINNSSGTPAEKLVDLLIEAEIHQIAGHTDQAATYHTKALTLVQDLQTDLARNLIVVELQKPDLDDVQGHWRQIVSGPTRAAPPASLIIKLLTTGSSPEAQSILSQTDLAEDHPLRWLVAAHLAELRSDRSKARQAARRCLSLIADSSNHSDQGQSGEFIVKSCLDTLPLLEHLRGFLQDLSLFAEAARATQLAEMLQPLNASILSEQSFTNRLAGDTTKAIACAHMAVALQPEEVTHRRELAASLEAAGNWPAALVERNNLMEARFAPPSETYWPSNMDWHALANCAIQAGDCETAIRASQGALNLNPEDGLAQAFMGEALLLQGNPAQAMEHFLLATQQAPHQPAPWLSLARAYRGSGQIDKTIETLRAASHAVPDDPQILFALAESYLEEDAPTQAQTALARAFELVTNPDHPFSLYGSKMIGHTIQSKGQPVLNRTLLCQIAMAFGEILFQLGHIAKASQVFATAYEAYPGFPGLAYGYGKTLLATGERKAALAPLIVAVGAKPQDPQPYIDYAQTLLELNENPEEAIQALQQAMLTINHLKTQMATSHEPLHENNPDSDPPIDPHELPTRPLQQPHRDKSYPSHWTSANLQTTWLSAQSLLAEAFEASGDLKSALKAFSEALESGPASTAAWQLRLSLGMSRVALQLDQPEVAIAALQEVSRSEVANVLIQRTLAEAYAAIHLPDEALQAAQTAVQIAPDDIETLSWFANLCILINARAEAIPALNQAVQLNPGDASLALRLGRLLVEVEQMEAAHQVFLQVIDNSTASPDHLAQVAEELTSMGDQIASIQALERACSSQSEADANLLLRLANLYDQTRLPQKALETIERAVQADMAGATLHFYKACLLSQLGRPQAAQASLLHALNLEPANPAFHLRLSGLLRSQGDLMAALDHADAAVAATYGSAHHPVAKIARGLAADISRALLQPELALRYLDGNSQSRIEQFTFDDGWAKSLAARSFHPDDPANFSCISAELALDHDEEIAAADALTKAIEQTPTTLRVQALQSRLAIRRGDQPLALQILHHALSEIENQIIEKPSSMFPFADELLALGLAAIDLEQWETALDLLDQASNRSTYEPLPALCLARAFILRAEYQRLCQALDCISHAPGVSTLDQNAYQAFQNALLSAYNRLPEDLRAAPPDLYNRLEARGEAAFRPSPKSIQALDGVRVSPDDDAAWLSQIAQDGDLGMVNQAYSAIREKYQGSLSNPGILVQVALSKGFKGRRQEDLDDSLAAVQSAIDQRPHQPLFHAVLSRLAGIRGNLALAQHAILTALSFWPDEPRWQAQAANFYIDSGDIPAAITHLEKAAAYEPDHMPHYLALGKAHLLTSQPGQAIAALEHAVQVAPDQPEGKLALASAYLSIGDLTRAAASAQGAVDAAPNQLPPLLLRADIALQMDDPVLAKSNAEQALRVQPDNTAALHLYAQALHRLGQTDQAMEIVEKAIPLAADPLPLLLEQTSILESLHGRPATLIALQELAERYPGDPAVLAPLAKTLAENNDLEEAIRTAQRALRGGNHCLRPREQAGLHYLLGRLLRQTGQLDQAIHQFSEAVQLAPDHLEIYLDLGETQLDRRQNSLAIQTYQKAIQIAPEDFRPFFQAGLAFKASRDYPGAETMLRRAAELAPDDLSIHRQLAALVALNLVHSRRPVPMDA